MTISQVIFRARTVVGALVLLSAIWLSIGAAQVHAIEQGGLGGKPANPKSGNSRSQSIFVHALKPGASTKDGVQIINNTPETKRVLVYAVDSQPSSGGAFACAQAADKPISVGTWVALETKEVTLAPGAKQVVDFTIKVPTDAAPGEHDGCIVIQDTKQQPAPDGNGIVLTMRSAIRLAVTIPGDIQKGLVFTGMGMQTKENDKLLLSTALKNNGNVSLDTDLDVRLAYPLGWSAASVGGNFPVLSSSEGRFTFEADRPFWGGWYRLVATAKYNDDPASSLGEGKPTASIAQDTWLFIAPHPVAAAIEAIAAAAVIEGAVLIIRRKLAHRHAMRHAKEHVVEVHEDLHTIAETYGMSWKSLARLNKLKPPYQVRAGQKLIVTSVPKIHKKKPSRP